MLNDIEEKKKKLAEKKQSIQIKEKLLNEKEKQRRAKQFAEIGKIAYQANIDKIEKETLLGAFLEISKKNHDKETIAHWKKSACEFLKKQESDETTPMTIIFTTDPSKEVKEKLKEIKFKWNSFRREFYGYGNKKSVESLLSGSEFRIEFPELDFIKQ